MSSPYLREEIVLPISFASGAFAAAEAALLAAARAHAVVDAPAAANAPEAMRTRYAMADADLDPAVYWRITDNWLELSLRFLVPTHGVREIKDRISRDILAGLDTADIGIASATYDIVGLGQQATVRRLPSRKARPAKPIGRTLAALLRAVEIGVMHGGHREAPSGRQPGSATSSVRPGLPWARAA